MPRRIALTSLLLRRAACTGILAALVLAACHASSHDGPRAPTKVERHACAAATSGFVAQDDVERVRVALGARPLPDGLSANLIADRFAALDRELSAAFELTCSRDADVQPFLRCVDDSRQTLAQAIERVDLDADSRATDLLGLSAAASDALWACTDPPVPYDGSGLIAARALAWASNRPAARAALADAIDSPTARVAFEAWLLVSEIEADDDRVEQAAAAVENAARVLPSLNDLQASRVLLLARGDLARQQDDHRAAVDAFRRLLDELQQLRLADSAWSASITVKLADSLEQLRDHEAAVAAYHSAVLTRERTLPPNDYRVPRTQMFLFDVLVSSGQYRTAASVGVRAITGYERSLGPESAFVGRSSAKLAALLVASSENEDAIRYATKAIAILEQPSIRDAKRDLAVAHHALGMAQAHHDLEAAEKHLERAIELRRREDGTLTWEAAETLADWARLAHQQGRLADALERATTAVRIVEEARGEDSPALFIPLLQVAAAQADTGDWPTARRVFERAVALAEKAFGDHPKTGGAHLSFARELLEHGEVAPARHHFERALELLEEHWGRESIQAGWTHEGLARAFAAQRDHEAAVSHLEQAQRIRERTGERGKAYERNERLRCDYLSAMGRTAERCAQ